MMFGTHRPFLEQRGIAERWRDGKRVDMRTYQIMIDLDDLWPTLTGAADMVSRLAPAREAHDRAYAEHRRPPHEPSWRWKGWFDRIHWSGPTVAWYNLSSTKRTPWTEGQKPGERAVQRSPTDEQSGETSPSLAEERS